MKKTFIYITHILLLTGGIAYSQVGVNTDTPGATMDVVAAKTDGSTAEGLIAPRLTLAELITKEGKYGISQNGAIVYITGLSGATPAGKTANVTQPGYYYYDYTADGWKPFGGGSGTSAGWVLTGNSGTTSANLLGTTDTQDLIIKTGTGANTERMRVIGVSGDNVGNVGIGTTTPDKSAILDVSASNKAIRIPNVSLSSATDVTTVASPQKGMIVYNTNGDQFAYFDGTQWRQPVTSGQGVITPKLMVMAHSDIVTTLYNGNIWYSIEDYDIEGAFDPGANGVRGASYTVPKTGYYQIFLNYSQSAATTGGAWYVRIIVPAGWPSEGSAFAAADTTSTNATAGVSLFAVGYYKAGTVITMQKGGSGGQTSAANLSKIVIYRFE